MTIHWKALEEHFLMAPLVFRLSGKMHFLNISQKTSVLKECVESDCTLTGVVFVTQSAGLAHQVSIPHFRVSEHFSKMLVLSGVFNTRMLDATNYANQDYMRVNYTLMLFTLYP
jgi:esterase/lipase superfamily enzyme